MRKILFILFVFIAINTYSQTLEVKEVLQETGRIIASENRKDNNGKYCAVIDVVIPNEKVTNISQLSIKDRKPISNGMRFFVAVPKKRQDNVRIEVEGFDDYVIDSIPKGFLIEGSKYKIVLKAIKPEKPNIVVIRDTVTRYVDRIVEKEVTPNKSYLILRISEPGANVYVNHTNYQVKGMEFKEELPLGTYYVKISKSGFEPVGMTVKLEGPPVVEDVALMVSSVDIRVTKDYDAVLFVDGYNYGKNQNVVAVSPNTVHTFKIEKNGQKKTKKVMVYGESMTVVMPDFQEKKPKSEIQSGWFLGYTLAPKIMSSGFSIGKCKRYGFILNGGFSKLAFDNWENRNQERGSLVDTFRISHIYSSLLLSDEQSEYAKTKGLYRSYLRFGSIFRAFNFLYLYAAAGIGTCADVSVYDGHLFASTIHKGLEGEFGFMMKYKRLGVSFAYVRNIGVDNKMSDFNLGVHLWMKQNKSHYYNRFFGGYRYSPSAPFGMSLGVAFGYSEKWGLLLNGGFSKYSFNIWCKRGENDSYDAQGFWLEEIRSVSLKELKEWGNEYTDQGVFRSYYHFGPFFRLNGVWSYYITFGYGNYAHIRKYSGHGHSSELHQNIDLYATKLHNGVDGEIGIMLKINRISFSLGYQHNVGFKNLFSDINLGVQVWFGR